MIHIISAAIGNCKSAMTKMNVLNFGMGSGLESNHSCIDIFIGTSFAQTDIRLFCDGGFDSLYDAEPGQFLAELLHGLREVLLGGRFAVGYYGQVLHVLFGKHGRQVVEQELHELA